MLCERFFASDKHNLWLGFGQAIEDKGLFAAVVPAYACRTKLNLFDPFWHWPFLVENPTPSQKKWL